METSSRIVRAAVTPAAAPPAPRASGPWSAESELGFLLGAKSVPFLTTATDNDNPIFDLPEWMESREMIMTEGETERERRHYFPEEREERQSLHAFRIDPLSLPTTTTTTTLQQQHQDDVTNTSSFSINTPEAIFDTSFFSSGSPGPLFDAGSPSGNTPGTSFGSDTPGALSGTPGAFTSTIRPEDMLVPLSELRRMQGASQDGSSPDAKGVEFSSEVMSDDATVSSEAMPDDATVSSEAMPDDATVSSEASEGNVFFPTQPVQDVVFSLEPQDNVIFSSEPQDNVIFSSSPQDSVIFSSEPQDNIIFSSSPQDNVIFSSDPQDNVNFSSEPQDSINFSSEPQDNAVIFSSEPVSGNVSHFPASTPPNLTSGLASRIVIQPTTHTKRRMHTPHPAVTRHSPTKRRMHTPQPALTRHSPTTPTPNQVPKIVIRVSQHGAHVVTPKRKQSGINDHHHVAKKRVTRLEVTNENVPQPATSLNNVQLISTPTPRPQCIANQMQKVPWSATSLTENIASQMQKVPQSATSPNDMQLVPTPRGGGTRYVANPMQSVQQCATPSPSDPMRLVPSPGQTTYHTAAATPVLRSAPHTGSEAADTLIDEMLKLIGTGALDDIEKNYFDNHSFDASVLEANLDSLLHQLDAENTQSDVLTDGVGVSGVGTMRDLHAEYPTPHSPPCLPSPVPSLGRVSPQDTPVSESMFLSPVSSVGSPSHTPDDSMIIPSGVMAIDSLSPQKTTTNDSLIIPPGMMALDSLSPQNTTLNDSLIIPPGIMALDSFAPHNAEKSESMFTIPALGTGSPVNGRSDSLFATLLSSPENKKSPVILTRTSGETRTHPRGYECPLETIDMTDASLFTSMATSENVYARESARSSPQIVCVGERTQSLSENAHTGECTQGENVQSPAEVMCVGECTQSENTYTRESTDDESAQTSVIKCTHVGQPTALASEECESVAATPECKTEDMTSTGEQLEAPSNPLKKKKRSPRRTPYPDDPRQRKKEQNKMAALRYRQKKKKEDDEMMALVRAEEERQRELKARYTNLRQEVTCLKKIMRDLFIAKGVLSPDAFKNNNKNKTMKN